MRRRMWYGGLVLCIVAGGFNQTARGDVKPHALFTEGMVLQQGMKVPVWGTASDGEQVMVRIQGKEVSTTAKDGRWRVEFESLNAGGPYEMTIAGSNTIQLKNVLVGEVWVCSGQSNMEFSLSAAVGADKAIASSANPMIRLFTVPKRPASAPAQNVDSKWLECNPKNVPSFSAVAYFFGRDVQKARQVPVGLIHTSWGGTPAESWTSRNVLNAEPSLSYMSARQDQVLKNYAGAVAKYTTSLQQYQQRVEQAIQEGREVPDMPAPPANPARNAWGASTLYNGMIAPLIPYAIRGAIWYQGESNAGRAYEYRTLLAEMIRNWRTDWKQGDFPFLIVQLAPWMKIEAEPQESQWAELREAQLLTTQKVPNTAEAVITDVGNEADIHPRWKEPVGARLALAARALAYGEKIAYSGPVYRDMKIEGERAFLTFEHVGGGLQTTGGPLVGFTVAGEDHKFVHATAEIQDDKVVVWSPRVQHPVAVRFGWANYPVTNLWNKDGLPATPFRTDDFPMLTNPRRAASR